MSRKPTSTRTAVALVLVSLVLALALLEAGLRLFPPGPYITPDDLREAFALPHQPAVFATSILSGQPRQLQSVRIDGSDTSVNYRINSLGYRGAEFAPDKPAGLLRIMIYGGSQVFNLQASSGQDWPQLTGTLLRQRGLGPVEVINAGIPGNASHDAFGRLFAEGHLFQPDILVLDNLWNDIKRFRETRPLLRSAKPAQPWKDPRLYYRFPGDRYLTEHLHSYGRLRYALSNWLIGGQLERQTSASTGADSAKATNSTAAVQAKTGARQPAEAQQWQFADNALRQYRLNLRMFVDLARSIDALPVLMLQPRLASPDNRAAERAAINYAYVGMQADELLAAFAAGDAIARDVATSTDTPLLDFSEQMNGRLDYFADHVHLKRSGGQRLAELMAERLAPLVLQIRRDRDAGAQSLTETQGAGQLHLQRTTAIDGAADGQLTVDDVGKLPAAVHRP